ncbi:hypothetical protein SRABI44_03184 [Microbacterium foliorum]|nr:hypothetical protein SRABI03_03057 [Microbacterium foliorum]CAH0252154.1 hypothetical protein SRABI44_03184 [Microbacterium foliorum]
MPCRGAGCKNRWKTLSFSAPRAGDPHGAKSMRSRGARVRRGHLRIRHARRGHLRIRHARRGHLRIRHARRGHLRIRNCRFRCRTDPDRRPGALLTPHRDGRQTWGIGCVHRATRGHLRRHATRGHLRIHYCRYRRRTDPDHRPGGLLTPHRDSDGCGRTGTSATPGGATYASRVPDGATCASDTAVTDAELAPTTGPVRFRPRTATTTDARRRMQGIGCGRTGASATPDGATYASRAPSGATCASATAVTDAELTPTQARCTGALSTPHRHSDRCGRDRVRENGPIRHTTRGHLRIPRSRRGHLRIRNRRFRCGTDPDRRPGALLTPHHDGDGCDGDGYGETETETDTGGRMRRRRIRGDGDGCDGFGDGRGPTDACDTDGRGERVRPRRPRTGQRVLARSMSRVGTTADASGSGAPSISATSRLTARCARAVKSCRIVVSGGR